MNELEHNKPEQNKPVQNKQVLRDFIQAVWNERKLETLPEYWTEACINHALPGPDNVGLQSLESYHQSFFAAFAAFSDVKIEVLEQVAESDKVVTRLVARGKHSGEFMGIAPTLRAITLETLRVDRLESGKIAEHRSIADMVGLMAQLQG